MEILQNTVAESARASISKSLRLSLIAYAGVLVFICAGAWQSSVISGHSPNIRPIGWNLSLLWLLGLGALLLQKEAGFPEFVDTNIGKYWRYGLPVITGVLFAVPDVILKGGVIDQMDYSAMPPFTQPFPYSVFLYFSGAFWVDVLFKLLPLTLIMLAARKFLTHKVQGIVFWIAVIVVSLYEPLDRMGSPDWFGIYSLISGFAFNFIAFWYYKRAGFFAALLVRIGHYLLWHIAFGAYIEFVLLQ